MKPVRGEAPVIGYEVSLEDLKVDYETYKFMYQASTSGFAMTQAQLDRYMKLKEIFEK